MAVPIGTYSIPIPGTNTVDNGRQPLAGTGITVAAGTYYRIRVNGGAIVTPNPDHMAAYPNEPYPEVGTYGPGGTGSYGELQVLLAAHNTDGSGTTTLSIPNLQGGLSAPDSAETTILYTAKEIEIQAGRNGIAAIQNDNCCHGPIGFYALASTEVVTVDRITDFIHLTAAPNLVHPNHMVVFTATRDDGQSPYVTGWHWDPDPGASGGPTNPCWWYNPCSFSPAGSGTMTVHTTMGDATAHVTIYASLTLAATPTSVHPGDTVTFTPAADGAPTRAARWRWVADDSTGVPTACADDSAVCQAVVHGPGTMWAFTAASGGDSASQHITVLPRRHLTLAPGDTVWVTYGSTVTFTASAEGARIANPAWSASGGGVSSRLPVSARSGAAPQRDEAGGSVGTSTCVDGVTTCEDEVLGPYVRSVTATVDDSTQTASVAIVAGTAVLVDSASVDNSGCTWGDGACWDDVPDSADAGPTYLAPQRYKKPGEFTLDFRVSDEEHHFFYLDGAVFVLRQVYDRTPKHVDAIYALETWEHQRPAVPNEHLLWANVIPIRSTLQQGLTDTTYIGTFRQIGRSNGMFLRLGP